MGAEQVFSRYFRIINHQLPSSFQFSLFGPTSGFSTTRCCSCGPISSSAYSIMKSHSNDSVCKELPVNTWSSSSNSLISADPPLAVYMYVSCNFYEHDGDSVRSPVPCSEGIGTNLRVTSLISSVSAVWFAAVAHHTRLLSCPPIVETGAPP